MNATAEQATIISQYDAEAAYEKLSGMDKAAIFLLALGRDFGQPIWKKLDDEEVAMLSQSMSKLGNIRPELVEYIFGKFISQMSISGSIHGNYETTERLLSEYLPSDRLNLIMEEIRGPAGRNMWEKLSNVSIPVLTNYLKERISANRRRDPVAHRHQSCRRGARQTAG